MSKRFRIPKRMTDKEAAKVILPKLPTQYHRTDGGFTESKRYAKRDSYGEAIVASRGDGLMHPGPKVWTIENPVERYLEAMGLSEAEADPRALNWEVYGDWCEADPQDGRCNVCGKGTRDGAVCDDCATWSEAIADDWSRTRQEAMLAAHMEAEAEHCAA